jgi:glycerol-3-phosphate acyltransferase PlsY
MMQPSLAYLVFPAAYLLGSVPFGVLVARVKGVDLQKSGSGNIGATNVLRTVGKGAAAITLAGDIVKGVAAVVLCRVFIGGALMEGIAGIVVVLGHMFPIFLSFRGGKGVATGFGVLAVYTPVSALIAIFIWLLTAFFTKYASLAAITAFASLPLTLFISGNSVVKIYFAIVLAFLIILRHRQNISRLLDRKESRIGEKTG